MRKSLVVALATVTVLTSACGDSQDSTTSIDIAKLDSGNYPTTPVDITSVRTSQSGAIREALNISSLTPIPFEYDDRFAYGSIFNYRQRVTSDEPPYFEFTGIKERDFANEAPGLVAGWRTFGQRRQWPTLGRNLETYTLRFETSAHAVNAAQKLFDRTPGDTYAIPGYADALTKIMGQDPFGGAKMRSWLVRDDILMYLELDDPVSRPPDHSDYSNTVKKFYDKQLSLLANYHRTSLNDISTLPFDIDGMLSRTMPSDQKANVPQVYPARAVLSTTKRPLEMSRAFEDTGVDYVSDAGGAIVYRTRDAKAAERLSAAFGSGAHDMTGLMPPEPHPEIPTSACYAVDTEDETYSNLRPQCRIVVGRYVARIVGTNLQDTYQRTAAQYKLLASAE
ncbi:MULTISPECIES: DUF7373 family lipoprotein [unclassified Nocardia]|uniref:DUF7373 family lipoprotein n=1 Tax=unclassified Nocardia TaxID=2637762 RepID=UPI0033ACEAAC